MRILVIEDDDFIIDFHQRNCKNIFGINTTIECYSSIDAVLTRLFGGQNETNFNIVISDYELKDGKMDFDVVERIIERTDSDNLFMYSAQGDINLRFLVVNFGKNKKITISRPIKGDTESFKEILKGYKIKKDLNKLQIQGQIKIKEKEFPAYSNVTDIAIFIRKSKFKILYKPISGFGKMICEELANDQQSNKKIVIEKNGKSWLYSNNRKGSFQAFYTEFFDDQTLFELSYDCKYIKNKKIESLPQFLRFYSSQTNDFELNSL